ncbi:hypothetical protein ACROYT_G008302 [Oculina patagonica]
MERNNAKEGQSTSTEGKSIQGMKGTGISPGINNAGNCDNWVHNPRNGPEFSPDNAGSTCLSTNTSLQPEQGGEQCTMTTGSYHGNNAEEIDPLSQQPMFTSPSDLGRKWHYLHRRCYQPQRSRNFSFTVVSYNVLADGLLQSNSHLYNGTEQWLKHWDYRRRNLLKELLHYNADVLCLQEVEMCHYHDWFEPKLREKGYAGVYKKRTGDKTDGCATFFKESRFTLVKSKLVSFNKPEVKLMDRDNVAIVVLLKPRGTGSASRHSNNLVCVSNTHLLFNKKRGDIKLAQLACLFSEIEETARISSPGKEGPCYHPIICCGDFNSVPFSPIYGFVERGLLDYTGMHRDNFSGQSHFRRSYPPMHALTSNLIPWELGITTSSAKRSEPSETDGNPCRNPERQEENVKLSGSKNLQFEKSKEQSAGLQSEQCSASMSTTTFPQSQPLNCTENETVQHEGEQTSMPSLADMTEKDAYNACTFQRHNFNFFSVYRHYFKGGQQEVTTFHDQVCTTVDYIFVSPGRQQYCRRCRRQHGPLQLTGNIELLTESDFLCLGGLPNKYLSSDHLSLVASFLLHI